ncbi:TlpA disulfide reductase family protein [Flavobacterium sp.]|uniref:TlpA disulfide reductase family protein n=1 Tax=Flavobacterium sp. TaxID=239 RepID=UPI002BA1482C|nr:TlpA disulfide reductase family protein [Flavobacterium sp.]HSD07827.1 TlpA disulfide reductase family protein [Flavobacterium sp.]
MNGVINGNYKGTLYFSYEGKKDSCKVIDNKFHYEGKIPSISNGSFCTERATATSQNLYLENVNMNVNISIEKKTINDYDFDFVTINSVSGTKTSLIQKDYEDFIKKHQKDNDSKIKKYKKIDEIVSKYPEHPYSLSLLLSESWDSLADTERLKQIYKKLDLKSQNQHSLSILKSNIDPVESSKVGKAMIDFGLPNEKGILIDTKQYRGSILLIDFWASWCAPCRKQIPEIAKVYEKFKGKNFKILSLSVDKSKEKWLLASEKEKIKWDNVLEEKEFLSEIVKGYEITSIPQTFLIDKNGIIIANNPSMNQLEDYLSKNLE